MANLKVDLLNKLNNEKYYEEMELVRLAQEPNMNYKNKIDEMAYRLQNLASLNAQIGLVGMYFQEPAPTQMAQGQGQPVQNPMGQVHPGQSHGE